MKTPWRWIFLVLSWAGVAGAAELQPLVDRAAQVTLEQFREQGLKPEQLAISVVELSNPERPRRAAFRGDVEIYPASVIKLFYLAATHRWLEDGRLADTPELAPGDEGYDRGFLQ